MDERHARALLRDLRMLEQDYPSQPVLARRADLAEINALRAQLGMPRVDANLKEIELAPAAEAATSEPRPVETHVEARGVYEAYLKKRDELTLHREYALRVAAATAGGGQTPVRPLATMGTGGGPLLCDRCEKPIVLEGGSFHGVTADVAWKRNPQPDWKSWILGGMVVELETNGTLRIYHGYPGAKGNSCCAVASREASKAFERFDTRERAAKEPMMLAFLEHEFPDMPQAKRRELLKDIITTMYSYDPGLGINRPDGVAGSGTPRRPRRG